MKPLERILFRRSLRLGVIVTVVVLLAQLAGWFEPLEHSLYDGRARFFQFFTPPPTDKLVHIDIDKPALDIVGRWPWPRRKLAEIIDEVSRAGPKVIGVDILLAGSEPHESPEPSDAHANDDHILAESLRRAGNVVLPISLEFRPVVGPDPIERAVQNALRNDLEIDESTLAEQLKQQGFDTGDVGRRLRECFSSAGEKAMFERIEELLLSGVSDPDKLRLQLIPRTEASRETSWPRVQFDRVLPVVRSVIEHQRFGAEAQEPVPIPHAESEDICLAEFAASAKGVGFVDLIRPRASDGIVRDVPLMANYRGRYMPAMALALAAATLDVDPRQLKLDGGELVMPLPDGRRIVIPLHDMESERLGKFGASLSVPWFGTRAWEMMYDYARHQEPRQHIGIARIWSICQAARDIRNNDEVAREIIQRLDVRFHIRAASLFLSQDIATDDWVSYRLTIQKTLADLEGRGILPNLRTAAQQLDPADRSILSDAHAMAQITSANDDLAQTLETQRKHLRSDLHGRTVLMSWLAGGSVDFYTTSIHPTCPGGVIQGVVFNGIITGELWRMLPIWKNILLTLFTGILTTLAVSHYSPWRATALAAAIAILFILFNGLVLFDYGNRLPWIAAPLGEVVLVWASVTLFKFIEETQARSRIRSRFSNYVDPAVVDFVEANPTLARLDGQSREMTVVYTDMVGFTALSERLGEKIVLLLNEYMGAMVPMIRENRGIVNKFLGDGIMFFYGAPLENPNHAADAVETIIQMRKALIPFNQSLTQRGLPQVGMRAGMTSGMMVVGDAGSRDAKHIASDYTVLGDNVNLAARLEPANKRFGSNLLMNQRTRDLIGDRFLIRPIGSIVVVGKSEAVMTYEALCTRGEATPDDLRRAELSSQIVEAFIAARFQDCIRLTGELEQQTGDTRFATTYRALSARHLTKAIPPDFDGRIELIEK